MTDEGGTSMEDRIVDPLVFPIGAGSDFGNHYLEAVSELRKRNPAVNIFGGHRNVSSGLPQRKVLNDAFITLTILSGCDSLMNDPIMNLVKPFDDFIFAANSLTARDEFSVKCLRYIQALSKPARKAVTKTSA